MITTIQTKKNKINVRLVSKGDRFGYGNLLVYTGNSRLIEFYDGNVVSANYDWGRFITRFTEERFNSLTPPVRIETKEAWKLTAHQKEQLLTWLETTKGTAC